jgi:hypothetical protein
MRRWFAAAAVAVALVTALLVWTAVAYDTKTGCTHEGLMGPDGATYGRSEDRGCQFVDDNGDLAIELRDGTPICYGDNVAIESCDEPGARSPG